MDVHRKRSQVAVVDEAGQQQRNRNLANDPAKLVAILGTLPPGTPVAFEAAYGWGWLVDLLEELELEPHLVHPSRCKAIASARLKNDKVDAATLAQLLRADLLPRPGSRRRPPGSCGRCCAIGRPWCAWRPHATTGCMRCWPTAGSPSAPALTAPGRAWLQALPLPPVPRAVVDDCCVLLDALATPIARLEREIYGLAKPDPRVQALMVLPGVGKLTAMTLVAEIGDIGRFPTARKLCAWAGLTPPVRNSDRKVRHGHITNQGSPWVRGSCRRPPTRPSATRCSPTPTVSWPTAAARTSPRWRSPADCWPAPFISCPSWRQHRHRRRPLPGALAVLHEPVTRPLP
jgi:transposase